MKKLVQILVLVLALNVNAQSLEWAKQFGGTAIDEVKSIVTDAAGNSYTTGLFNQTADFDPGVNVFNLTALNDTFNRPDVFIIKMSPSGDLIWAKRIGGVNQENVGSIVLDAVGNVYITGSSESDCDFDPGPNVVNLNSIGYTDLFILKLDTNGNFIWAKRMGGGSFPDGGSGNDIVIDANQNVYITGNFRGTIDFNPSTTVNNLTSAGSDNNNYDVFVLKLDNLGNYVWACRLGGIDNDLVTSIALDSSNNVYTAGSFINVADFDPSTATFNLEAGMFNSDTFISKLDTYGNFIWAKSFKTNSTGFQSNFCFSAVLDNQDNICITGSFTGQVDFDTSANVQFISPTDNGGDIYVAKLNSLGNLIFIKQFGGTAPSQPIAICTDALNNIYTTGRINSGTTDFDPGAGNFPLTSTNAYGTFISKLDSSGSFVWAKALTGTSSFEKSFDIFVDTNNNVHTVGYFAGTLDFDPNAGISTLTTSGLYDGFIQKMTQSTLGTQQNSISYVKIYPNPTTSQINLSFANNLENATIKIISTLGQTVLKKQNLSGNNFNFDVSSLANGIYIIQISDRNTITNSKFIKQ